MRAWSEPREEAFAAYDDAIAEGHGAFLLDEERPDVFTASIGNLASGAEVQIELTYVAELPLEDDSIRFTLPTTVSPRFAPREDRGGIGRPAAEVLNPPRSADVPYGLSFTARVATPGKVRRIESPSHPISVELDDDGATVTLAQQQTALDRDLVLLVTPGLPTRSQVVLERTRSGRIAAALTFRPAVHGHACPRGHRVCRRSLRLDAGFVNRTGSKRAPDLSAIARFGLLLQHRRVRIDIRVAVRGLPAVQTNVHCGRHPTTSRLSKQRSGGRNCFRRSNSCSIRQFDESEGSKSS